MGHPWRVGALVLATLGTAQAQQGPDGGGEGVQLEQVDVTGRRALQDRFFAPGSMVVLDRRDIEKLGAFSIADVLRQLPGVVATTNADGSVEIRMRGMERSATQILVDGQRQATGRGQLALDQLPPEMVERIEVVRSPSAEFSGATGGTINIVLRQATVRRETTLRVTDNTVWGRHAAQIHFSRTGPLTSPPPAPAGEPAESPWAYFLAASSTGVVLGSDSHSRVDGPAGTTVSDGVSRYRRQEYALIPRVSGKLGPRDQLRLAAVLNRSTFGGTLGTASEAAGGTPVGTLDRQDQMRHFAHFAMDWTHGFDGSKVETSVMRNGSREHLGRLGSVLTGASAGTGSLFDDRRREDVVNLKSKVSTTGSPLLRMGGFELERWTLGIDTARTGVDPFRANARLERGVLWAQDEWAWGERGTLTAGLRGESIRITTSGPTLGTVERHIPVVQPSVHLRQPLGTTWQYRANLARTTRNPRVWDLIDRTNPSAGTNTLLNPDSVGNPALRPETTWALDTGVERRLGDEGQAGGNLFVRRVQDAIGTLVSQAGGRWFEQRTNVGDAMVTGLEFDARTGLTWLGLPRDWTLNANFSLLHSRMTSGANEGQRIPGQPRYTGSLNVAKPIRRSGGLFGGFTLNVTGAADLNTSPGRTGRDRPRTTLDVHFGGVVAGLGYWRVGLQNITDAPYRRTRRYDDPVAGTTTSEGDLLLTPRAYLTMGTQF
ncbi:TonB-dependent receptor plug domain-containing protein [Ramlibacter algicola]|uniref:TonB-dependent receptor n=1 Tax=Ramlibacter algicola TaxID=2795217 RepID=A0A934Q0Z3_9BURK|nr:TonB-dependent receptor [Ramlibacter algicola]MBK0394054.1 TonB-dependent receptor [Ramlibacter algicola]